MSQPVKISDELMLDARLTGEASERSIAKQVEYWARLGRAIEPSLSGEKALALRRRGDAIPLSELIAEVETADGATRLQEYLGSRPYPHYEPAEGRPGLLTKVEADGTRTVGRFVRGKFRVAEPES